MSISVNDEEFNQKMIEELRQKRDECARACDVISKELTSLEEFAKKEKIQGITLDTGSTLIDLLRIRILDTDPNWKTNIDILINIPHSEKGDTLRGGDYFEALFQLAIAIGILPQFQGFNIVFHDIIKYGILEKYENYLYRKTIKNSGGSEQGISDITFELLIPNGSSYSKTPVKCGEIPKNDIIKNGNPYYFISVKGYKREKSIAKGYDIPLLSEQTRKFPEITNKHIVVCVRNKEQFLKRLGRSRMEFLKNSIDHVIGYDEIIEAFSIFRTNFFLKIENPTPEIIEKEVLSIFPKEREYKPSLSLYFHQELVVKSVLERIKSNNISSEPHFLCIGVLPRGGKSYIAGGIIDMHRKMKESETYNVLFLTSAINETREQFRDDLIKKFSEFEYFEFIDPVNPEKTDGKKYKFKFVFLSRQLSSSLSNKKNKDEEDTEVSSINDNQFIDNLKKVSKDTKFDICFFDEAHIGIRSENVRDQFNKTFKEFKMPIILMTATYKNLVQVIRDPNDIFVWDLQDVKDMKDMSKLNLKDIEERNPEVLQRYPNALSIIKNRIKLGQTEEQIATPYVNFPSPNFISLTFTPDTIKHLKDNGLGYDYMKAFQIDRDLMKREPDLLPNNERYMEWRRLLKQSEDALRIRQFLTPEQEGDEDFLVNKERKYRALNQIFSIAQKTGSRPLIGKPFSMIMFLPFGQGIPIGELCRIWASFFLEKRYWRENFVFLTLSEYSKHKKSGTTLEMGVKRGLIHREDFSYNSKLKNIIQDVEQEALKNGKGLVLLSGDVAKMGISLKCVDVVCLMSNNKDADDIIQKMYRALTDDPPTKKNGFIIDLNLTRIVEAFFEYDSVKAGRGNTLPVTNTQKKEIMNKLMELCNWGQDAYIQDHPEKTFDDVMFDIRQKVFDIVLNKKLLGNGTHQLVENQFKVIQDNPTLFQHVKNVLQNTTGKQSTSKKETLLKSGINIPTTNDSETNSSSTSTESPNEAQTVQPLTDEQIKKKIIDIMITFINALVIKSNQPFNDMTFEKLIQKYNSDKASATFKCECGDSPVCGQPFSNLYDTAYCELKGYAYVKKNKKIREEFPYTRPDLTYDEKAKERNSLYNKKNNGEDIEQNNETKTIKTQEYDPKTHENIMNLMDEIFANSGSIAPDWTAYIDSLIHDITKGKIGGRRKTKRNKNKYLNNNANRTKRNNIRDY